MTGELKAARARYGYSQKNVATFLGLSIPGYRFKEDGKNDFTIAESAKLSKLLKLKFIIEDGKVIIKERKES